LGAKTSSNAEFGTYFDDEDEVYSKLTRSELVDTVKDLINHYQTKSKEDLQTNFNLLVRENDRNNLLICDLKERNGLLYKITNKRSDKPLSEQEIALQEFIMTEIDIIKVASMIYGVRS
jgi:hypothetical protein